LIGIIAQEGSPGGPVVVHTEAHNSKGNLLAEAEFKVIPLAAERFKEVAGIEKLPENWSKLLGERDIAQNSF